MPKCLMPNRHGGRITNGHSLALVVLGLLSTIVCFVTAADNIPFFCQITKLLSLTVDFER